MPCVIRANHHWRDFVYRQDVPADVLADRFDWTSEEEHYDGFFNYKGWWYHLDEFMAHDIKHDGSRHRWDGYHSDSFFSGVVIRLSKDGERFQVGTYNS
jgi:hypothetical protein